jgi:hypothetical protein
VNSHLLGVTENHSGHWLKQNLYPYTVSSRPAKDGTCVYLRASMYRNFFSKTKAILIEVASVISLALVILKILITEAEHLFR